MWMSSIANSMTGETRQTESPQNVIVSIRKKFADVGRAYPDAGSIKVFFLFIGRMVSIFFRLALARIYLRKCNTLGQLVTTRKKPMIKNHGEIHIGNEVAIWSVFDRTKLLVHPKGKLTVGNKTRINGVHISVKDEVKIGHHVRIGPYTLIMDSDFHDIYEREKEGKKGTVEIGNHVWIASKVTILKGVKIGEGSMIAAGSVVTKDIPSYSLAAGVPARVIKDLRTKQ